MMAGPKKHFAPQDIEHCWRESRSMTHMLELLGMAKSNKAAIVRLCSEAGVEFPAPHWSRRCAPPEIPEPPEAMPIDERLLADVALDRVKAERDEYRALYEEARSQVRSQQDIAEAIAEQCVAPRKPPSMKPRLRVSKKLPERCVLLQVSDWQIGELVRPEETGGVNEYNWAVFQRRLRRWVDAACGSISNQLSAYRVPRGVIAFCGDMVEGHDVFNGQAWHLEKDAAMQALDGAAAFAEALSTLVSELPMIDWSVYCVPGNHGKPGGRKAGATPATFSFDVLFQELLRRELSRFPWSEWAMEPSGRLCFTLAGHPFVMIHGNEVRGWSGIPWYGLDKLQARLMQEMDRVFKFVLLGHFHQSASIPSGKGMRIINGSAVGANQLTQAAVLGATAPSQNLLYFSREFGLAEHAYLHLAPGEAREPRVYGEVS